MACRVHAEPRDPLRCASSSFSKLNLPNSHAAAPHRTLWPRSATASTMRAVGGSLSKHRTRSQYAAVEGVVWRRAFAHQVRSLGVARQPAEEPLLEAHGEHDARAQQPTRFGRSGRYGANRKIGVAMKRRLELRRSLHGPPSTPC
jgi:hypothetical protein